ncbi:uncharacterized protein EDB91DRAFT_1088083 [Suillus paluster]|uniref:uncharacterized protein n=1 Tax=Suillus paluster TaxID=48578 RepID=UPI001B877B35|nr:uncharacterized protein EDB91DRAFT_1088083 [Suillus paluster]KAG1722602.1 hypothetical protein EDB91DRAFT_1088083 [Suillus paluster]
MPQLPKTAFLSNQALRKAEVLELKAQQDTWASANRHEKKNIFNAICRAVQFFGPKLNDKLLKKRHKIYHTWLYNHTKVKQRRDKIKYGKKWTARMVVSHKKRDQVLQRIKDETGLKPGDPQMFKYYQGTVKKVVDKMPADKMEIAMETAEKWSNDFPPPEIQASVATKKGPTYIKHFAKEMWRQCGMRVFMFGGDSFTKTKDWSDILPVWQEYAEEQFNVGFRKKTKKLAFELEVDGDSVPVLPDTTGDRLEQKKAIVRSFLTENYTHILTPTKDVSVEMQRVWFPGEPSWNARGNFISSQYLPDNVQVKDPLKLQTTEAVALLDFWYDQQENGVPLVFEFKRWKNGQGELVDLVEAAQSTACGRRTLRSTASVRESSSESLAQNVRRPRAVARLTKQSHSQGGKRAGGK